MTRPLIDEIARRLSPGTDNETAKDSTQSFPGGLGVVAAVNMDGSLGVTYNGAVIPAQPIAGYIGSVGDTVLVVVVGTLNFAWSAIKPGPWASLAASPGYASGWADNTGGNPIGEWRQVGDKVEFRGNIAGPGGTGASLIASTFPQSAWPTASRVLLSTGGNFLPCSIYMTATGELQFAGAPTGGDSAVVWLDNISYSIL